jgi:hypothetical protein
LNREIGKLCSLYQPEVIFLIPKDGIKVIVDED